MNYDKFKESLKKYLGRLYKDSQWEGFQIIASKFYEYGYTDDRHLAYMLATALHETAFTMKPITEYGSKKYLMGKKYWPYVGRGYVQLTWKYNYDKYNISSTPERALEPDLAAKIIVSGMESGIFTGKKLSDYFSNKTNDPVNARRIINGTDKAHAIAGYYNLILKAVKEGNASAIQTMARAVVSPIVNAVSALVPKSTPKAPHEKIEQIIKDHNIDREKYPVVLVGVRGYYLNTMGKAGENDRGIYDDAFFWCTPTAFLSANGNTDPSRFRKGKGTGKDKGMADMIAGTWMYKPGMHNGSVPHPAFRQADKVTVLRDGDPDYLDTGMFGINIHRGGKNGTSSLGCQTVPPAQWDSFKTLGYSELTRHGQKEFPYILVENTGQF